MKIDAKIFKNYINKVSINSTILTVDLQFTPVGIKTAVKNNSQTAMAIGLLKQEAFEEYEEIGNIYIRNAKMLIGILKTFTGSIKIDKIDESMLRLSNSKRKAYVMLAEEKICDSLLLDKKPQIIYDIEFPIDKKILTQTISDMNMLSVTSVNFVKTDTNIGVEIGKSKSYDFITNDDISENITVLTESKDISVGVGGGFIEVVNSLGDDVILRLKTDSPLTFIDKTENMLVEYLIAPFIESDN